VNNFIYFWYRRDLRIHDNHGLYQALTSGYPVRPIFIFDRCILDRLTNKQDARVHFIHTEIEALKSIFRSHNSDIEVYYGNPTDIWQNLIQQEGLRGIYTNEDYEPYALLRDQHLSELCSARGVRFQLFKDQVIFAKNEVVKDDGNPYTVFTPYMKKWKLRLQHVPVKTFPSETVLDTLDSFQFDKNPSLTDMGFKPSTFDFPPKEIDQGRIKNYEQQRDIPSIIGTSRLSLHFRFGTLSIREKFLKGHSLSEKWINELIWREFYMQILWHFPHVVSKSFKPAYDRILWRNHPEDFEQWKQGKTGYPMVDAGMRELHATGFMHNRVRMVVASFLCKHLLIDWRWGESYFAEKLLDFELASNNGGWQWAAGSGVDAAPYFRVFNPQTQLEKFDPNFRYVKKWIPEYGSNAYPKPIVEHKMARERCLEVYKSALSD
jgi:deoxyribodipyrimidine photo-lyase